MGAMEKSTHTSEYAVLRAELCAARKSASLSQRELALRLEVPHSWVAKVESGERRIDLVEFCLFVTACGLNPHDVSAKLIRKWQSPRIRGRAAEGGTK
jgi:transcriptional regulator with XRE-family HTH domain